MNLIFLDFIYFIYKIRKCGWIRDSKFVATLSAHVHAASANQQGPLFSKPPVVPMMKPFASRIR